MKLQFEKWIKLDQKKKKISDKYVKNKNKLFKFFSDNLFDKMVRKVSFLNL